MAQPEFQWSQLRFLDEQAPIEKSRRHLPHWQQAGKIYFVTFRLKDSLPGDLLGQWRSEKSSWMIANPTPWTSETEAEFHRKFSTKIDRYLDDGLGSCLLRDPLNAEIVEETFRHFDGNRYTLQAFVVMPNHVHLLVSLNGTAVLEKAVSSWKRYFATRINRQTNDAGELWQEDYFDRLIRDWDHFANVCRYIRNNPAKAGLSESNFRLYLAPWVARFLG